MIVPESQISLSGRISQCSDISGLSASSSDSGLGTPSDHSISLFDYLTLDRPQDDRPLDEDHLEHLYGRLESYSVDMMLHKLDRVNKLGAEILSMEETLLDVS